MQQVHRKGKFLFFSYCNCVQHFLLNWDKARCQAYDKRPFLFIPTRSFDAIKIKLYFSFDFKRRRNEFFWILFKIKQAKKSSQSFPFFLYCFYKIAPKHITFLSLFFFLKSTHRYYNSGGEGSSPHRKGP